MRQFSAATLGGAGGAVRLRAHVRERSGFGARLISRRRVKVLAAVPLVALLTARAQRRGRGGRARGGGGRYSPPPRARGGRRSQVPGRDAFLRNSDSDSARSSLLVSCRTKVQRELESCPPWCSVPTLAQRPQVFRSLWVVLGLGLRGIYCWVEIRGDTTDIGWDIGTLRAPARCERVLGAHTCVRQFLGQ